MSTNLDEFIARSLEAHPAERKIVRKVWKALDEAGTPIVSVYDGDEDTKVNGTLKALNRLVFNLDEAYLKTRGGGWVRIVMGNGWDAMVDYTLNHEDALKPVSDYIERHW